MKWQLNASINTKKGRFYAIIDTDQIVHEVQRNGFYSAYCHDVVSDMLDFEAQVAMIKVLASHAQLQVSFNEARRLCIFEAAVSKKILASAILHANKY